jgi:hypothetical protein
MTMQKSTDRLEMGLFRRAFEQRDSELLISLYADDAELRIVSCNNPPSSPFELHGKQEIGDYWRDVFSRQMTHLLEQEVVGEDSLAVNVACKYPDGTRVLATMMFDLHKGKIVRQVDVQAWDV